MSILTLRYSGVRFYDRSSAQSTARCYTVDWIRTAEADSGTVYMRHGTGPVRVSAWALRIRRSAALYCATPWRLAAADDSPVMVLVQCVQCADADRVEDAEAARARLLQCNALMVRCTSIREYSDRPRLPTACSVQYSSVPQWLHCRVSGPRYQQSDRPTTAAVTQTHKQTNCSQYYSTKVL